MPGCCGISAPDLRSAEELKLCLCFRCKGFSLNISLFLFLSLTKAVFSLSSERRDCVVMTGCGDEGVFSMFSEGQVRKSK